MHPHPGLGQQLVRQSQLFSNARRVSAEAPASESADPADPQLRRQDDSDNGEEFARARSRLWARLIKKGYEEDRLSAFTRITKIISLIGDSPVIEKILRHLKLWDRPERPPPCPAGRSIQYDEAGRGRSCYLSFPDCRSCQGRSVPETGGHIEGRAGRPALLTLRSFPSWSHFRARQRLPMRDRGILPHACRPGAPSSPTPSKTIPYHSLVRSAVRAE